MSIQTIGGAVPELHLHQRLRIAREYAGYGQVEFAQHTGISRATISAAENGHRAPLKSTIKHWALATGVNAQWLETGVAPSGSPNDGGTVNSYYAPTLSLVA